ncbi:MAG TPA: C4-dicarboxylate ABC transporter [Gammaproteobacteria bacterium]|nr:C4-dicarboxylate ABC transporter [Gammaproteobacteria bacterium]
MPANEILAVLMLLSFIALVFTGFPIAWILGGLAVVFTALAIVLEVDFNLPMHVDWGYASLTVERIWNNMENWVMVALPMFVFMGLLLDRSGIAGDLMRGVSRLLASVRGGLALTVILIGLLLAATTGIVGASVVLLALLGLPAMMAQGYDRPLAAGTVAAVGTLGILIPPSIMLVLMADRMAMSVGDLFLGAVMPGLLLGALYIGYVVVYGIVRPEGAPAGPSGPIDRAAIVDVARAVIPPTGLILLVLGSIFFGLATPTEAAGVGAAGALALAWSRKQLGGRVMPEVLRETTITTGFIFGVMLGATAFALVLRGLGGDKLIEEALLALPFEPDGIVLSILFATFLLGFFLDWIELTLIILPLVAPVVTGLGYDPVWFTVLFAVCLQTSFLTPPVGFALFFLKGVAPPEITARTIYKGVAPFILLQLLAMTMIFFWPQIVTWLPEQAYG